jgi:hypothetical protein
MVIEHCNVYAVNVRYQFSPAHWIAAHGPDRIKAMMHLKNIGEQK